MLSALSRIFGKPAPPKNSKLVSVDLDDEEIPRYPPFAKGLPVAPIDRVIATQAELIERIRSALGFSREEFATLVLPVIHRYAEFVHLLPASESHHHRGAGGLFRHGLEVAFWAAQASEAVIFSMEGSPRERRNNEPRWRLASCFAGMLHDVGKPLSDVSVSDKDGTLIWDPYVSSLYGWADSNSVDRYFLRWRQNRHKRHERFSTLAIHTILPTEVIQYLSGGGTEVMFALLEAISGGGMNQPVTKLMMRADQESVTRDLKNSRLDVDGFAYGVPVERYVFDAIRRLVKTGKWKVNEPGARVWHLHQGVFITWRQLGDLYELIEREKIPGIPRDPDTLADILIERDFAVPYQKADGDGEVAQYRYWDFYPDLLQEGREPQSVKLLGLRLESHELVFTTEPPPPVKAEVVGDKGALDIEFEDLDGAAVGGAESVSTDGGEASEASGINEKDEGESLGMDLSDAYEVIASANEAGGLTDSPLDGLIDSSTMDYPFGAFNADAGTGTPAETPATEASSEEEKGEAAISGALDHIDALTAPAPFTPSVPDTTPRSDEEPPFWSEQDLATVEQGEPQEDGNIDDLYAALGISAPGESKRPAAGGTKNNRNIKSTNATKKASETDKPGGPSKASRADSTESPADAAHAPAAPAIQSIDELLTGTASPGEADLSSLFPSKAGKTEERAKPPSEQPAAPAETTGEDKKTQQTKPKHRRASGQNNHNQGKPVTSQAQAPSAGSDNANRQINAAPAQSKPITDKTLPAREKLAGKLLALDERSRDWLNKTILPVIDGTAVLGEILFKLQGDLAILYPEGAQKLGEPAEVMNHLWDAGLLAGDPVMPDKKIRASGDYKGLVLTPSLARLVNDALDEVESERGSLQDALLEDFLASSARRKGSKPEKRDSAPEQIADKPGQADEARKTEPTKSTNRTESKPKTAQKDPPKQSSHQSKDQKAQAGTAATGKTSKAETAPAKVSPANATKEQRKASTKHVEKKRAPAARSAPSADSEPRQNSTSFKPIKRADPKLEVAEKVRPKRKVVIPEIDEADLLSKGQGQLTIDMEDIQPKPKAISPEEAVAALKQMILNGEGKWLAGAVRKAKHKRGQCLVTSGKAFDFIASEYADLSKGRLRSSLRRGQHSPIMFYDQEELYLLIEGLTDEV